MAVRAPVTGGLIALGVALVIGDMVVRSARIRQLLEGFGDTVPFRDAFALTAFVVHPYTVNESTEMTTLVALGVDGMFTNFPDRLKGVLSSRRGQPRTAPLRCDRDSAR